MLHILRQIARVGIKTEPRAAPAADEVVAAARLQQDILRTLGRALTIRHVDAGSCNACELEAHALMNPYYNIEGLGIRFVASPRHADVLLVTGPVSKHMAIALWRTYDATPEPKLVIAAGDCACGGGIFGESYATMGAVDQRAAGRCRDSRLPAVAHGAAAGHSRGDHRRGAATREKRTVDGWRSIDAGRRRAVAVRAQVNPGGGPDNPA